MHADTACVAEVVAFFNRNLKLVHLYGLFGSEATGFRDMPMPELTDLRHVQDRASSAMPTHFFDECMSGVGAFGSKSPQLGFDDVYIPDVPRTNIGTSSVSLSPQESFTGMDVNYMPPATEKLLQ